MRPCGTRTHIHASTQGNGLTDRPPWADGFMRTNEDATLGGRSGARHASVACLSWFISGFRLAAPMLALCCVLHTSPRAGTTTIIITITAPSPQQPGDKGWQRRRRGSAGGDGKKERRNGVPCWSAPLYRPSPGWLPLSPSAGANHADEPRKQKKGETPEPLRRVNNKTGVSLRRRLWAKSVGAAPAAAGAAAASMLSRKWPRSGRRGGNGAGGIGELAHGGRGPPFPHSAPARPSGPTPFPNNATRRLPSDARSSGSDRGILRFSFLPLGKPPAPGRLHPSGRGGGDTLSRSRPPCGVVRTVLEASRQADALRRWSRRLNQRSMAVHPAMQPQQRMVSLTRATAGTVWAGHAPTA
ncbi:hypothetical protein CXG81DRAFT_16534 [Caulochytrium protostelioides]|uniref:Uncharacterized protein n=1 Tax=Caulochytrium protostelioides TaxID=1555241 RepID=A0A4P9WYQ0_9FUNG|nr:hypothetical protein CAUPRSCDRAFT_10918 [Caulochytrium protostelioides]RKP03962.1 hypothetical protein CXG81DRAFT_16534 [Caulochytrium protostelioides]|eukprot:RKP03962.1 hypothetical protein CXG81DRAFT_16534 [Caulochytrium protostelioides]